MDDEWVCVGFEPPGIDSASSRDGDRGDPKAYFIMLLAFLKVGKRRLAPRLVYMELALSLETQNLEFTSQLCHLSVKIIVPKF